MIKVAMFDTKTYDRESFTQAAVGRGYEFKYIEARLTSQTASLAVGCQAVCAFVNDEIDAAAIDTLAGMGVQLLAMRCAGYSNVDFKAAYKRINVVRVPAYSPYAVAEHAMALLLAVDRRLMRAYNRTREFNFALDGLTGTVLHGKTAGVVGVGRIGRAFMDICHGMGMEVLAYDPHPRADDGIRYVPLDTLLAESDVISLHCPLTPQTAHLIDARALALMKPTAYLINTSRGALIDTPALLEALNQGRLAGVGLDVYEEEKNFFFNDLSERGISDAVLAQLIAKPNVIVTAHQAFLTREALANIAATTLDNMDAFFADRPLNNEVCYQCHSRSIVEGPCPYRHGRRCFYQAAAAH